MSIINNMRCPIVMFRLTINIRHRIVCRLREKLGSKRVSKAYEFYDTVKEDLKLPDRCYFSKPKPPFEATKYMLYYFAANELDAAGRQCDYVLDRSQMWNSTSIPGCRSAYDFVGITGSRVNMRVLPCACAYCCGGRYAQCSNVDIVGRFVDYRLSLVECPDYLQLPLEGNRAYTAAVLKVFLRAHNVRVPSTVTRKADIIRLVMQNCGDYLLPANAEA